MPPSSVSSIKPAIENPHSTSADELIRELETDQESGLSREKADELFKKFGPNQLKKQEEKSILQIIIDQINNPIVYLLTAAAALALAFGERVRKGKYHYPTEKVMVG